MERTLILKTFPDTLQGQGFDQTIYQDDLGRFLDDGYQNFIITSINLSQQDISMLLTLLTTYDVVNVALLKSAFKTSLLPPKKMKIWYVCNLIASLRFNRVIHEPLSSVFGVRGIRRYLNGTKFSSITELSLAVKYYAFKNFGKCHEITLNARLEELDFDLTQSVKFILFGV